MKSNMLTFVVVHTALVSICMASCNGSQASSKGMAYVHTISSSCCLTHFHQTQISLIGRHAYIELAASNLGGGDCLLKFFCCSPLTLAGFVTVHAAKDVTVLKASHCPDVCHLLQDCLQYICWAHKYVCLPSNHVHLRKRKSCHHP
jgi:hypothetical protein